MNTQSFTENKIYRCLVYNDYWQLFTPEIVLNYFESPLILKQPASVYINQEDYVIFGIDASGIETPAYQWYFMGNEMTGATTNNYIISQVSLSDSGFYQCKVWNNCGEVLSDTAWLKIKPNGVLEITCNQGITAFPNPVTDQMTLVFSEIKEAQAEYFLYSVSNKLVMHFESEITNGESVLKFGVLPKGIYILKGIVDSKSFIVKIVALNNVDLF
jgi:hypothetical protein